MRANGRGIVASVGRRNGVRRTGATLCFGLALLFSAGVGAALHPGSIRGIYALESAPFFGPRVLENPNVDGLALRYHWDELEPADNQFFWAKIDREIAAARSHGKKVSIGVSAGARTPQWVYAAGAAQFVYTSNRPWDGDGCRQRTIPVPWDPIFLSKWKIFVRELGRRYDPNPAVVYVKITGINSNTQEAILPHSRGRKARRGDASCGTGDEVTNWQQVGYTRGAIERAWTGIADTFAEAFPHKKLGLMIGPRGFPPIDDAGKLIPRKGADLQLPYDLISIGIHRYGARFVLQNNGLSAVKSWDELDRVSGHVVVGWQMVWSATGDPRCRMTHGQRPCDPHPVLQAAVEKGIASRARFLEVYTRDIVNPQLQDVLSSAHQRLAEPNGSDLGTVD